MKGDRTVQEWWVCEWPLCRGDRDLRPSRHLQSNYRSEGWFRIDLVTSAPRMRYEDRHREHLFCSEEHARLFLASLQIVPARDADFDDPHYAAVLDSSPGVASA